MFQLQFCFAGDVSVFAIASCAQFDHHPAPPLFAAHIAGVCVRAGSSTLRPATVVARCSHVVAPLLRYFLSRFTWKSHEARVHSPIKPVTRLAGPEAAP
jgi:hypothetical protein